MVKSLVFFDDFYFNSKTNDNAIRWMVRQIFSMNRDTNKGLIHSKNSNKKNNKLSEFSSDHRHTHKSMKRQV